MSLREMQADPAAFRRALVIDADGGPRRLGDCIEPWQAADFAAVDPAWRRVVGQSVDGRMRAYLERPRGHSKTGDIAASTSWALFASRRKLRGVAAAADKEQAKLLRDAIDGLVRLNPWLAKVLDVQAFVIKNRHTGSELQILSSDAASSYGLTPDFIVCDELTHWIKPDLWHSLFSAAAKRSNCLLFIIANAGFQDSWQWPLREAIRTDPLWYFHRLEGPQASWITAERLAEQRRLLPDIAYARLWLNLWSSGSGDALSDDDIKAALAGVQTVDASGWAYYGGLDLGHTRDAAAFVVVGRHVGHNERRPIPPKPIPHATRVMIDAGYIDHTPAAEYETIFHAGTGRLRLVELQIWKPTPGRPVPFDEVERAILNTHSRLPLSFLYGDPWNFAQMQQRLFAAGIPCDQLPFTGPNLQRMATATLDAFRDREIEIPETAAGVDDLLADLRNLRAVERSYGFRLESPRATRATGTRHGDTATGLQLSLVAAGECNNYQASHTVGRELVCYP